MLAMSAVCTDLSKQGVEKITHQNADQHMTCIPTRSDIENSITYEKKLFQLCTDRGFLRCKIIGLELVDIFGESYALLCSFFIGTEHKE